MSFHDLIPSGIGWLVLANDAIFLVAGYWFGYRDAKNEQSKNPGTHRRRNDRAAGP